MLADKRDEILQRQVPAVMVPRFGELEPLQKNGHRFLIADDGVHLEVHRPWMHAVWPVAISDVPMPYGSTGAASISNAFDWVHLMDLVKTFVTTAQCKLPNECGAWVVWHEEGWLSLVDLAPIEAGPGHLKQERPSLDEGLHLVCDIHSHGHLAAGFSTTDDADDAGEVKYAAVVGNVGTEPSFAMRLCLPAGLFIDSTEWSDPA